MNKRNSQNTSHDFAGLSDWFAVFESGERTDSKGRTRTFTNAELDSVIANHSDEQPAPLVIGHPEHNDPAYGWTAGLKRVGNMLYAKGKDIVAEFEQGVAKKMWPNRSVSLEPDSKGGWKLRHIGFLGAKRPAVEGLGNINFSANGDCYEFAMSTDQKHDTAGGLSAVARMLRRFRDWLIDEKDLETADNLLPDWEIEHINTAADRIRQSDADGENRFSSPDEPHEEINVDPNNDKQFSQADLDAAVQNAVNSEQQKHADRENKFLFEARLRDAKELVTGLTNEGRLLPAQSTGLAEFMASLPDGDDSAFEFSAGDDKKEQKTPAQFIRDFVGSLGKQINLGESHSEEPGSDSAADFQAPAGATVDPERAKLHKKALEYQATHNCDYIVAVTAVENGGN